MISEKYKKVLEFCKPSDETIGGYMFSFREHDILHGFRIVITENQNLTDDGDVISGPAYIFTTDYLMKDVPLHDILNIYLETASDIDDVLFEEAFEKGTDVKNAFQLFFEVLCLEKEKLNRHDATDLTVMDAIVRFFVLAVNTDFLNKEGCYISVMVRDKELDN